MRWMRFSDPADPKAGIRYAIVDASAGRLEVVRGDPFVRYETTGAVMDLATVRIEVPVIPGTFYAVGRNYQSHVDTLTAHYGQQQEAPRKPDIGYRANSALAAHDDDIVVPADATDKVHYEGELVVVIGKKVRHVSEEEALDCIFGYTIGNDISDRNWQKSDRTMWRSKNTDTWKPMGPWIETEVDLDAMETEILVNGATTSKFRTRDMIYGIARYISTVSRNCTLHPGDVLWMGTAEGSPNLLDGDVVEIRISGIGALRNRVVRETAPTAIADKKETP